MFMVSGTTGISRTSLRNDLDFQQLLVMDVSKDVVDVFIRKR